MKITKRWPKPVPRSPDPDKGFWWKKIKQNYRWNKQAFLKKKQNSYLKAYKLQENIWFFKTTNFLTFVLFVGLFCIPGSWSRYTDPNQSGSRYTDPNQSGSGSTPLIKSYLHGLIPEESLYLRMGEGRPVGMEKSTDRLIKYTDTTAKCCHLKKIYM